MSPACTEPAAIDSIFAAHDIAGAWRKLPALGIANEIFATQHVVLRVATDDPQAIPDARTESVAAPAAYAAGIVTPRLIAFDDSRRLVDRPYSLWERVHGETFGAVTTDPDRRARVWWQVGREMARLHSRIDTCEDPRGWLDAPGRRTDLEAGVHMLRDAGRLDERIAMETVALVREIAPSVVVDIVPRFVHDDLHAWNIMCSASGDLLALIDWGDAGWGDPTLDFAYVPLNHLIDARAGYESEAPGLLGPVPEARFVWDHLQRGLENMLHYGSQAPDPMELRRLLERWQ